MSLIGRFAAYAADFEKSFESDDWSLVEPYFTEDAVYEAGIPSLGAGRIEGRAAILAYFPRVLDALDRRFESREIALLEGPFEEGRSVRIRGTATYRSAGVPDLVLELEEVARFEPAGETPRIVHLEDRYEPAVAEALVRYLEAHGERLGLRRVDEG